MKIEIIKPFRLLTVGQKLDIDREYSNNLIKKGFAKSLEIVEEVKKIEVVKAPAKEKAKK